jgi:hypothetical protein
MIRKPYLRSRRAEAVPARWQIRRVAAGRGLEHEVRDPDSGRERGWRLELTRASERPPRSRLLRPRPLAIALVVPRPDERPRVARHVVVRRTILLAMPWSSLHGHLVLGLRTLRIDASTIHDRVELFERIADRPGPLILAHPFDGLPADRLLAMIRTAGWTTPVVVVAPLTGPLPVLPPALGPVTVVRDPTLWSPDRNRWLRHCLEAFRPPPGP